MFDHQILGSAYADMYPTDVVASSTHYFVNDNGRYRLVAINRVTGLIDYEKQKVRVSGLDDLSTGRGMGMDSAGDIYVADTLNNAIFKVDQAFNDITHFGQRGDAPGEFRGVNDVAVGPGVDDLGNATEVVYASDKTGHVLNTRINKFTTSGRVLGTLGSNMNLKYGQLVVDPATHNVYATEAVTQGFVIFNERGALLRRVGGRGGLPGQFKGLPRGVAVRNGKVFVTDSDNRRIQVFDTNGNFLYLFGSLGTGLGQFIGPKGLVVTDDGKILVCDLYGYGLDEFDLKGNPLRSLFGTPPPLNGVNKPRGLDLDARGRVNVIDWWRQAVIRVRPNGSNPTQVGMTGDRDQPGALTFPTDVRVQRSTGLLYIANRESDEVEVLNPDGTSHLDSQFGRTDLTSPVGLAHAPDGTVVVADSPNNRLVRFVLDANGKGTAVASYGVPGSTAPGELRYPQGVDVAADGTIWVADSNNDSIQKMAPNGTWTRYRTPAGGTSFTSPWGVRVGPDGVVYVTDSDRIVAMTANGNFLAATTSGALFDGRALFGPEGIAVDASHRIFISDTNNDRVLMFVLLGLP